MGTRNRRAGGRKCEWVRAGGTLELGDVTQTAGDYDAHDLFGSVKAAFTGPGGLTDVTVTVVRGYIRPNIPTAGAGERLVRGRVGIRMCEETDITSVDSTKGPGLPGNAVTENVQGAHLDWFGYMPFALEPTSQDSQINREGSWSKAACPWHVDIESARTVQSGGMTCGIFAEAISSPPGGDAFNTYLDYDLSLGIRLP